jgi:signal recognition particle GTPase
MSDEQTPDVEEIKNRLSEEPQIPVEESETQKAAHDVSEEFRRLGQQFSETLQRAWRSEERHRLEGEVRRGLTTFANEVDKALSELKETKAAKKAKEEASELREKVETGEVGYKTRRGVAQGLQWLSQELAKLAEQFTPVAEEPADDEGEIEIKIGDETEF